MSSFINFHALVLEIECLQKFGDIHTNRQTFSKDGQIVFKRSQSMQIRRKPDVENFRESNTFFLYRWKKIKIDFTNFMRMSNCTEKRSTKKSYVSTRNLLIR